MTSLNKFVVRLLTEADELLAWAEVYAEPRPQPRAAAACPWWPVWPTAFPIERAGVAAKITVHWCDLDLSRVQAIIEPTRVDIGQVFNFGWLEPIWLVAGMKDVPLPTVTVRQSVTLGVPIGSLTAGAP